MTDIRGIIFDIDGVLEFQGSVYPGAVETLKKLRDRGFALRFLTNSTLKSRASCAARLRRAGYRVSDDEVITASYATEFIQCWWEIERLLLSYNSNPHQSNSNCLANTYRIGPNLNLLSNTLSRLSVFSTLM